MKIATKDALLGVFIDLCARYVLNHQTGKIAWTCYYCNGIGKNPVTLEHKSNCLVIQAKEALEDGRK